MQLPTARDFLWQDIHCTPLAGLLSSVDAARLAAFEEDVVQGWQPWSDGGGMTYEQGMIVAMARK